MKMFIKRIVMSIVFFPVMCLACNVCAMKAGNGTYSSAQKHENKEKETIEHEIKIKGYRDLRPYLEGESWPTSKAIIDYRIKKEDVQLFLETHPNIKDLEITDCTKVCGFLKSSTLSLDSLTVGINIRSRDELAAFIESSKDFPIYHVTVSYDSYHTAFSDKDLKKLVKKCPGLISLTIDSFQRVTKEGLMCLADLKKLTSLNLTRYNNIKKDDLRDVLKKLSVLQRVVLPDETELSEGLLKSYLSE